MERPQHFEDYQIGEGRKTSGRTITETDFVVHAGHTGDFFPHHMDAEAMKASQWGQRIAHGTMTFAIGIGLKKTNVPVLCRAISAHRVGLHRESAGGRRGREIDGERQRLAQHIGVLQHRL